MCLNMDLEKKAIIILILTEEHTSNTLTQVQKPLEW